MKVTLGDERVVESTKGVQKLPPGPMPAVLASEVCRPFVVDTRDHQDAHIPASLWSGTKERRKVDKNLLAFIY